MAKTTSTIHIKRLDSSVSCWCENFDVFGDVAVVPDLESLVLVNCEACLRGLLGAWYPIVRRAEARLDMLGHARKNTPIPSE